MKLTLNDIKRISEINLNPETHPIFRIPILPHHIPSSETLGIIRPFVITFKWNPELQDYESDLEIQNN